MILYKMKKIIKAFSIFLSTTEKRGII